MTVVAWIFIALAGLATLVSLIQAVMFALALPGGEFFPVPSAPELEQAPAVVGFMMRYMGWFFATFWALSVVTLVAAIGLLRRRNWARLLFIVLMALGIGWNLGGIWLQAEMMGAFPMMPPHAPPDVNAGFETMMTVMRFVMAAFAIGVALLFAWIIRRLVSDPVRAEFRGVALR